MSKYTTEVRFLCESLAGYDESQGGSKVNQILEEAAPLVFDFDFPIFDPEYRLPLEIKILRHYYTREISEETVGLWKLRLEDRMNLIMPYYNQLYHSLALEFNPLYDIELTTEHSGSDVGTEDVSEEKRDNRNLDENIDTSETNVNIGEGNNSFSETGDNSHTGNVNDATDNVENKSAYYDERIEGNESGNTSKNTDFNGESVGNSDSEKIDEGSASNSNTMRNRFSDTPQGGLTGLENDTYLTNATKETNDGQNSSNNKSDSTGTNVNVDSSNTNEVENRNNQNRGSKINDNSETNVISGNSTKTYDEQFNDEKNGNNDENTSNIGANDRNSQIKANEIFEGNTFGNKVSTNTNEYLQKIAGKTGGKSYSQMLMEYRESFINVDEMIIEELSDLFFGLW